MQITIKNMYWLAHMRAEEDLCAHGTVAVEIGGAPLDEDDICISAAALFLLRSLSRDHTRDKKIGDQLLPHCGHTMYAMKAPEQVVFIGNCNEGIDWQLVHNNGSVIHTTADGRTETLCLAEWQCIVHAFVDEVAGFYRRSAPKEASGDDLDAFITFQAEWAYHRGTPLMDNRPNTLADDEY